MKIDHSYIYSILLPTKWNLRGADETGLNKVHKKPYIYILHCRTADICTFALRDEAQSYEIDRTYPVGRTFINYFIP
jgi:hypothetical protein